MMKRILCYLFCFSGLFVSLFFSSFVFAGFSQREMLGTASGTYAAVGASNRFCSGWQSCMGSDFACAPSGSSRLGNSPSFVFINGTWNVFRVWEMKGDVKQYQQCSMAQLGHNRADAIPFDGTPTAETCKKRPDISLPDGVIPDSSLASDHQSFSVAGYPSFRSGDDIYTDISGCLYVLKPDSPVSRWVATDTPTSYEVSCKDGVESDICAKPDDGSGDSSSGAGDDPSGSGSSDSGSSDDGGASGGDSSGGSSSGGGSSGGGSSGGGSSGGGSSGGGSSGGGSSGGGSSGGGSSGGGSSGGGSSGGGSSGGGSSGGGSSGGGSSGGGSSGGGSSGDGLGDVLGWLKRIYDSLLGQSSTLVATEDSVNQIKQTMTPSQGSADSAVASADSGLDAATDSLKTDFSSQAKSFFDDTLSGKYFPDVNDYFVLDVNRVVNPGNLNHSLPVKFSFTIKLPALEPWTIEVDTSEYTAVYDSVVRPLVEWAFNIMTVVFVYRIIRRAVFRREDGSL